MLVHSSLLEERVHEVLGRLGRLNLGGVHIPCFPVSPDSPLPFVRGVQAQGSVSFDRAKQSQPQEHSRCAALRRTVIVLT